MTLSKADNDQFLGTTPQVLEGSSDWNTLYCSRLWTDSNLRNAIINKNVNSIHESEVTKDCNLYKDNTRNEPSSCRDCTFIPNNHSTPNGKLSIKDIILEPEDHNSSIETMYSATYPSSMSNFKYSTRENHHSDSIQSGIPSISCQVDTSCRRKYSSTEVYCQRNKRSRLRKSRLRGVRCFVSLSITDNPVKKRTQIQACSISVMIVAIVIISFVLVHFTSPSYKSSLTNKIEVPMQSSRNFTTEVAEQSTLGLMETTTVSYEETTSEVPPSSSTSEGNLAFSIVMARIRQNLRTFPKGPKNFTNNNTISNEPKRRKEINNRDLTNKFCSCQNEEVCMLQESTGTALCRKAIDIDDPTGCGGLCALETEACQIVDKSRGVRVCRQLTPAICTGKQWRCRNGLCVSATSRCDGVIQCYDRSDEMYCDCDLNKHFRCGHAISCFPNIKLCDGVIDCWDGHDEINCTTECPEHQFTCTDGDCIAGIRFCDGLADCADGSDEPRGCDASCGAHELRCQNRRCVPRTAICDGYDDCGDATDEMQCS